MPLTVYFSTTGTATSGSDYSSIGTSVTLAPGQYYTTLTVTPIDDSTAESTESVVVNLSSHASYTLGSNTSATVNIEDNDSGGGTAVVNVSANDPTAAEAGSSTGQFTITRTGGNMSQSLMVSFAMTGTATSGSDYSSVGMYATIGPGQNSTTVTITPIDDSSVESNETAILTLSSGSGYTLGTNQSGTVTISDNDTPPTPTVTISATDSSATETGSGTGQFTVTRTGSTSQSLVVNFTVSGTATSGSDYTSLGTAITIAAGQSTGTLTVTPNDDSTIESSETVIVTLASGSGYNLGSTTSDTVTISDNDTPVITIGATDPTAAEAGPGTGQFTITRTGSTTASLVVNFSLSGTATSGNDFTSLGTSLTIAAGQATGTLTVTPVNDTQIESNETVIVTLSTGSGYALGSTTSDTVTIEDDDTAAVVTITASDALASEAGLQTGQFQISRSGGDPAQASPCISTPRAPPLREATTRHCLRADRFRRINRALR